MGLYDYTVFEECVAKAFELSGFSVNRNVPVQDGKSDIDIVATKDGKQYYVEVKLSQETENAISQIIAKSQKANTIPILTTAYKIPNLKRQYYCGRYPDLELIDISNLLYAVQDDSELRNKLIAALPYSLDNTKPEEGFLQSETLMHTNYTESLIGELRLCLPGRSMAGRYEKICQLLLENIFSEDLALWKPQQGSNSDLYRFDLLCRIKDGNQKTFWSIIERFFNSKYIVFEFKNYTEAVTQKEIYTTEKYLYAKALRSVGIIIAANGYDENARWAAKGCLRENGKLIILLDVEDLVKMNEMKMDQDDPADYLLSKLDELLLELEK